MAGPWMYGSLAYTPSGTVWNHVYPTNTLQFCPLFQRRDFKLPDTLKTTGEQHKKSAGIHTHASHHGPNSYLRFDTPYHIVAPAPTSVTSSHILAPTLTFVYARQFSSTHDHVSLHTTVVYGTHKSPTSEPTKSIHQLPHLRPMSEHVDKNCASLLAHSQPSHPCTPQKSPILSSVSA